MNAQFDPDAARTTLLHRKWNERRLGDLGSISAAVALDRFLSRPADGWWAVPLIDEISADKGADEWVQAHVRELVIQGCQLLVAHALRVPTAPDSEARPIAEIVYEALPLDGLLTSDDQMRLAPGKYPLTSTTRDEEGRWREVLDELGQSHRITVADALAILDLTDEQLGQRDPSWYVRLARAAIDADLIEDFLRKRAILLADGRCVEPPAHADPQSLVCRVDDESLAARLGLALQLHPSYLNDDDDSQSVIDALKRAGVLLDELDSTDAALDVLAREGMEEKVRLTVGEEGTNGRRVPKIRGP